MHHSYDISLGFSAAALTDALVVPALFVGVDLRVVFANDLACRALQVAENAPLTGRLLSDLVCDGQLPDPGGIPGSYDDADARGASVLTLRVAGAARAFRCTPLHDAGDALLGFLLQSKPDVEAPVLMQDDVSLAESEWRWKTAVLSANQAVWDHDFERDRHYVSGTWKTLRGLTAGDPIPATTEDWLRTIHPQDLDHIKEELRRLDENETDVINYKFRQKHTAGHWVWFLSIGRVVRRDADGFPARIIGTDTDITDIKTVEMESNRMARRLDTAMDAAGMGRWEFDIGATGAFWDDRLLEMFGITAKGNEVPSADWAQSIHPDDREEITTLADRCIAARQDIACDFRLIRPDGEERVIRTRGKYVTEADGNGRYYGVNIDVTRDYQHAGELEQARARLEHASRHAAMTGLANRRYLDDVFSRLSAGGDEDGVNPAVLHFDIDHFKQINDTLGHDAGDATLCHAARVLKDGLPPDTLVSRVGGDEFVALFVRSPGREELCRIARSIIRRMSRPFLYGSQQCNIGTSVGIAVSENCAVADTGLFINADLALYAAKKAGRGRFRFFDAEMKEEARRRKNSFDALVAGFDQGEITCHYQPQFDAQTLELTGLEALARWESSEFGLMMPDEFLSTAEDMGLLAQFDELVLKKALADLQRWERLGLTVPGISVNVSSHRLNDPKLGDRLQEMDLPADKLSFELLESTYLDAKNEVIETNLRLIEELGIDIEIDDFGSGHASIVSLLRIAPKRLKIDRMLVQPIVGSHRQRELIRTIVGIGRMLDVRVVAEGVETTAHVALLQEIGCCYLQGYGLARPMDADSVTAFLEDIAHNNYRLTGV